MPKVSSSQLLSLSVASASHFSLSCGDSDLSHITISSLLEGKVFVIPLAFSNAANRRYRLLVGIEHYLQFGNSFLDIPQFTQADKYVNDRFCSSQPDRRFGVRVG